MAHSDERDDDSDQFDPLTGEKLDKAILAATLVVFREDRHPVGNAAPQLLMVERSAKMAFAAGAAVFPGGRVDADDYVLGARFGAGLEAEEAASRVAAIRETLEETGLAIGISAQPPADRGKTPDPAISRAVIAGARAALHRGQPLSQLCDANGWMLDLAVLKPFARWRPPFKIERIFDTRFYIAIDDDKSHHVAVDETENTHLFWATAAQALTKAEAGEVKIIFPTKRNLERLAQFQSFAAASASAAKHPVKTIIPFLITRDGTQYLCLPDDAGYPITQEPLGSSDRG